MGGGVGEDVGAGVGRRVGAGVGAFVGGGAHVQFCPLPLHLTVEVLVQLHKVSEALKPIALVVPPLNTEEKKQEE